MGDGNVRRACGRQQAPTREIGASLYSLTKVHCKVAERLKGQGQRNEESSPVSNVALDRSMVRAQLALMRILILVLVLVLVPLIQDAQTIEGQGVIDVRYYYSGWDLARYRVPIPMSRPTTLCLLET
ncbi:hypothetical protein EJ05DRAFT_521734 [Pseudovirgaria hyperparasitica]|uniref:Uncharacterized protein n=1 Tax=Pseudovirgaria hyperparasitica TaxID=470096 RepID=A0A6A6WFB8_9PEZI|nr:uncharacterized protein EJ05DRAFT_521734 [Pseudovirgaria hyperparasitica]KAF2761518.1 hypothetical protein EJ05DRAFT_521734 [Pseudovirgaria hyperparasitica]